jgi:hypothetical protein
MKAGKFKDCYVEMTLTVKSSEMFVNGKLVILKGNPKITAVLHEVQANNTAKLDQIKRLLWNKVASENGWQTTLKENINSLCSVVLKPIPRKSLPITFNI